MQDKSPNNICLCAACLFMYLTMSWNALLHDRSLLFLLCVKGYIVMIVDCQLIRHNIYYVVTSMG